jgi:hypothetical protein
MYVGVNISLGSDSCTTHIVQLSHNQDIWSGTHACRYYM